MPSHFYYEGILISGSCGHPGDNNNNKAPETGACVSVWCAVSACGGCRVGVRSQVVGMAASRFWRTRFRRAHALPAQAMRLTANTAETVIVDAPRYQVVLVDITLIG